MAAAVGLSVDPSGVWSPRQAKAVLDVIRDEARAMGLVFEPIEITMMGGPRRMLLTAFCLRHGRAVALDTACESCIHEARR